jgi:hypothetical protein
MKDLRIEITDKAIAQLNAKLKKIEAILEDQPLLELGPLMEQRGKVFEEAMETNDPKKLKVLQAKLEEIKAKQKEVYIRYKRGANTVALLDKKWAIKAEIEKYKDAKRFFYPF